jgi:sugar phosphate isomerase/epimerase
VLATKDPKLLYGVQIAGAEQEAVRDLPRLLGTLRDLGFTEVELHSIVYNRPAATLRRMIEDAGLRSPAGHFALLDIEKSIEFARELGLAYMIAMLPRPRPESLDEYRAMTARLNEAAANVHSGGMEFALLFHNHELMPQQGSSGFAELMKYTEPKMVHLEVDVYWVAQAGLDPASFLERYKDRVKLLHLKDRLAGFPTSYTTDAGSDHSIELGKGTIPWQELLRQARQQGIRYAFLDYDKSAGSILDSFGESLAYLDTLIPRY